MTVSATLRHPLLFSSHHSTIFSPTSLFSPSTIPSPFRSIALSRAAQAALLEPSFLLQDLKPRSKPSSLLKTPKDLALCHPPSPPSHPLAQRPLPHLTTLDFDHLLDDSSLTPRTSPCTISLPLHRRPAAACCASRHQSDTTQASTLQDLKTSSLNRASILPKTPQVSASRPPLSRSVSSPSSFLTSTIPKATRFAVHRPHLPSLGFHHSLGNSPLTFRSSPCTISFP